LLTTKSLFFRNAFYIFILSGIFLNISPESCWCEKGLRETLISTSNKGEEKTNIKFSTKQTNKLIFCLCKGYGGKKIIMFDDNLHLVSWKRRLTQSPFMMIYRWAKTPQKFCERRWNYFCRYTGVPKYLSITIYTSA
jgi:hypothetical protein